MKFMHGLALSLVASLASCSEPCPPADSPMGTYVLSGSSQGDENYTASVTTQLITESYNRNGKTYVIQYSLSEVQ
jgi:hypothetical protein